ncbi:hypothetical protein [Algoriphagus terrigena]|uniref:hypothetical protein n=1 Tax=Algoriphagus terrigena TaxID=344884 RepID=UPI0012F80D11|nr:hypothetical protein [Algoriphagus terrigena]
MSSKLLDLMEAEHGMSRQAARQKLSRSSSPIHKLKGYFQKNQTFVYLQETYKTEAWYYALVDAFSNCARRYYSVIKALEYHHGYLGTKDLPTFTFSPISNLTGHKRIDVVLQDLIDLEVLELDDGGLYTYSNKLAENGRNLNRHKGVELARKVILQQFDDWAKKINLTSFNTGKYNSEFGKFQWGYTSPSYVHPLRRFKRKGKVEPGFILADALIGNITKLDEVSFFIEKTEVLKKQKGIFPFMPFLLVEIVDKDALDALKQKGVMVGFIDKLFGTEYIELIKSLIQVVENAGAILKKNPDRFLDLMKKLSKLVDGKVGNLRGDLFELAVGYFHGQFCNNLDIGKKIFYDGEKREIDVFASYTGELRIAECKGYKNALNRSYVHEWLTTKIPVIRRWALDQEPYRKKDIIFELWCTGGFDESAIELLENHQKSSSKIKIEFFDLDKIMEKAKKLESSKFQEVLEEYYIKADI